MGRTNTKKQEARAARLKTLPQSERLVKSALIKKKEGRVLDASEKHALKMTSEHGEMLRLWEKLRTLEDKEDTSDAPGHEKKKTAYEHKYPVVEKLLHLLEPKFANLVRTPSASRVVQSMIKYGSAAQVEKILKMISKDFTTFATDAYAHFVVCALIRHVPHEAFTKLLASVVPAVPQLVSHKFGIEVIHATYSSKWCSATDRNILLLAVFKENVAVMKRWPGYPNIEDVLAQNPALRKRLLTRLFDLCDKLVSQKDAVSFPFVQRLTYAYIRNGTRDEVSELCDTLRPHLANIAEIREGAPLASLAFSLTEPKKRKEVLHNFSTKLGELMTNKYAAPVIARLFDLLYDAQMLKKYVANDVAAHIGQVVNSPYGYMVLMHLLTPHEARKERFLLPNWKEHNLYSVENKEWNHHSWLTADFAAEVVEICSKPAATSHLSVLPTLVEAFLKYATDPANEAKLNRHHAGLIAREVLHVVSTEPLYKASIVLSAEDMVALARLSPAQGKRDREEEEEEAGPTKTTAPKNGQQAKKKSKTEVVAAKKKSVDAKASAAKKKVSKK